MSNRFNMPAFTGAGYGPGPGIASGAAGQGKMAAPRKAATAPSAPVGSVVQRGPTAPTAAVGPKPMQNSGASLYAKTAPGKSATGAAGRGMSRKVSTERSDAPMRRAITAGAVKGVPKIAGIPKLNPKGMGKAMPTKAKPKTGMK